MRHTKELSNIADLKVKNNHSPIRDDFEPENLRKSPKPQRQEYDNESKKYVPQEHELKPKVQDVQIDDAKTPRDKQIKYDTSRIRPNTHFYQIEVGTAYFLIICILNFIVKRKSRYLSKHILTDSFLLWNIKCLHR